MYQTEELDKIRKRIDELDNNVHDLLLERADLVMKISEEKKKNGIQIVQPAREARMIRRLLARHRAPLPEETIVRIWRELVGSISLLQTGLSVVVYDPRHDQQAAHHYWDMARDYFGSVLPMSRGEQVRSMLNNVNEGKVNFAVLPYPSVDDPSPWWVDMTLFPHLNIIQRLPYGHKENYKFENHPALVISKSGFDTSDDDHSVILISNADGISQARVVESFKKASLEPIAIFGHNGSFFVEVKHYIAATDDLIASIKTYLNKDGVAVRSIGGYPTPLSYKKI
jgi:chorismate mutase/prephenate dehydratase